MCHREMGEGERKQELPRILWLWQALAGDWLGRHVDDVSWLHRRDAAARGWRTSQL